MSGRRLGLNRGAQVHEILRARLANGEPIVLEEAYLPAAVFPGCCPPISPARCTR